MNKEDIIRMAREAGFREYLIQDSLSVELERFAALVAAHEREECVRAAIDYHEIGWAVSCASAIRARSKATQDDVWAHPSMDGREKYETGERKPK